MSDKDRELAVGLSLPADWRDLLAVASRSSLRADPSVSQLIKSESERLKLLLETTFAGLATPVIPRPITHPVFAEWTRAYGLLSSPLNDLINRGNAYTDLLKPSPGMQSIIDAGLRYQKMFTLPASVQAREWALIGAQTSALAKSALGSDFLSVVDRISTMRGPWLHAEKATRSSAD